MLVGILSTELVGCETDPRFFSSYECTRIIQELTRRGHEGILLDPSLVTFKIDPDAAFHLCYQGRSHRQDGAFRLLDALLIRRTRGMAEQMLDIVDAVAAFLPGLPLFDPASSFRRPTSKIESLILRSAAGLPHPPTLIAMSELIEADAVPLRYPMLAKPVHGARALNISVVRSTKDLERVFRAREDGDTGGDGLFLQEMVAITAEYRVFVVDGTAIAVARRFREGAPAKDLGQIGDAHFEPTSERDAPFLEEACQLAVSAVKAHGLSFAGVDVIVSGGKHYLLECNRNPQFQKLETASGANVAGAVVDYIVAQATDA